MITKEIAIASHSGQVFYHVTLKNADGTSKRCRVNGKCKTWKTRINDFRIPVKFGFYGHGYITQDNNMDWVETNVFET